MGGHRLNISRPRGGSAGSCRSIAFLVLAVSAFITTPAAGQTADALASSVALRPPPAGLVTIPNGCVVVPHQEEDGTSSLVANCRGHGLILGRATDYQVLANDALGAWVVDMHLGTDRHVWLLSLQDDGQPLLEDISGQIARAAGKSVMADIEGLDIDFAGFARDGTIGVRGGGADAAGSTPVRSLALRQQITLERSRR